MQDLHMSNIQVHVCVCCVCVLSPALLQKARNLIGHVVPTLCCRMGWTGKGTGAGSSRRSQDLATHAHLENKV